MRSAELQVELAGVARDHGAEAQAAHLTLDHQGELKGGRDGRGLPPPPL